MEDAEASWKHCSLKQKNWKLTFWEDFNKVQDVIQKQTRCRTQLFCFPGGASNTISANYCEGIMTQLAEESAEKGYTYVDWNITDALAEAYTFLPITSESPECHHGINN